LRSEVYCAAIALKWAGKGAGKTPGTMGSGEKYFLWKVLRLLTRGQKSGEGKRKGQFRLTRSPPDVGMKIGQGSGDGGMEKYSEQNAFDSHGIPKKTKRGGRGKVLRWWQRGYATVKSRTDL